MIVFGIKFAINMSTVEIQDVRPIQEKIRVLQKANKAVFVDVTADWCVTCKVNEFTVLNTAEIQQLFSELDIEYLVADWTQRDDDITQYLRSFSRSGVPLYVFYPVDQPPMILPQLLTKRYIEDLLK